MKVSIVVGLLVLIALPIFIGQACGTSDSTKSFKQSSLSSLDSGITSDKPILDCSVINTANNAVISRITDLSSSSSYPLNPPSAPVSVRIDCASSSSTVGGSLSFTFKDGGVVIPSSGAVANTSFASPRVAAITVEIRDSKTSAVNSKAFNLPVACNPASYAPLTVNGSALSITAAAQPGYVNINFAGVASGGTGNYAYAIDLNGDGRFDHYNQNLYSSVSSFSNMYTLFAGARNVGIRVLDTGCQFLASGTKNVNFTTASLLPALETGAMATEKPYYYIQGNVVRSVASDTDLANNVSPFQSVEAPPLSGKRKHVACSYNKNSMAGKGTFEIKGINSYSEGASETSSSAELVQGTKFTVSNITDDGGTGPYQATATMDNFSYQSAASQDGGASQYIFNMRTPCSVTTRIVRAQAAVPCQSGEGIDSPAVQIFGVYSCPLLQTSNGAKSVSMTNGYFFCEVAPADGCIGGGGQGGGGEPPIEF